MVLLLLLVVLVVAWRAPPPRDHRASVVAGIRPVPEVPVRPLSTTTRFLAIGCSSSRILRWEAGRVLLSADVTAAEEQSRLKSYPCLASP